jgi:hypothetical protein
MQAAEVVVLTALDLLVQYREALVAVAVEVVGLQAAFQALLTQAVAVVAVVILTMLRAQVVLGWL